MNPRSQPGSSFASAIPLYERSRPQLNCFATHISPLVGGRSVLEVASGTGILSRVLRDSACGRLLTTDIDLRMVRYLKQQGFQAICSRGEQLPFADHSFDVIAIAQALHWLNIEKACSEFRRVLKDGILIVIRTWPDETIESVARIERAIRGNRPSKIIGTPTVLNGFRLLEVTHRRMPLRLTQGDVLDVMATRNRYLQSTANGRMQIRRDVETILSSHGQAIDYDHVGEAAVFAPGRPPNLSRQVLD